MTAKRIIGLIAITFTVAGVIKFWPAETSKIDCESNDITISELENCSVDVASIF